MLNRTLRPLTRSIRSLSTSTSPSNPTQSTRTNLYLGTLAASIGLISVGYAGVVSDNKRVWNDATGSGNWDEKKHQYNEDLKVNRHKSESAYLLGGIGLRGFCSDLFFTVLFLGSVLGLILLSSCHPPPGRLPPSRRSTRSNPRIPPPQQQDL